MKIHRPVYIAMIDALEQTFNQSAYADKVIERKFKENKKWGARDRRLFAESIYDVVRWWRRLLYSIDVAWSDERLIKNKGAEPPYSQEDFERVLGAWMAVKEYELPISIHDKLDAKKIRQLWSQAEENLATGASIPDWLNALGEDQLGAKWPQLMDELNHPAPVFLRVNSLKTNRSSLIERLAQEGIAALPVNGIESAVRLQQRKNVFITRSFREGLFEVQDAGSQMIVPLLEVEPGQRVIDACAGAGGKTLHMASFMQNKGRIVALDVHEWKLKELKKRAARAGAHLIEPKAITSQKVVKRLDSTADRVLLDVPCTGLGVLRRNPDSKWKLSPQRYIDLLQLQAEILGNYSRMVRPEGKLVYATCSILPSENENQVRAFLSQNENWQLDDEVHLWPEENGHDGFYAARLKRLR